MSLTAEEIAAVVAELDALKGGVVQKVFCTERRAAYFELRKPGKSVRLCLCAEADRTRIHVTRTRPPSPDPPFAFQGLLRKELVGRRIAALRSAEGDRVVYLEFDDRRGTRTLVAELTGRHGNLLLLDDAGVILGLAADNLSARRDLFPGRPYVAPLGGKGRAPGEKKRSFELGAGAFPLSTAIDAAYAEKDVEARISARRRALLAPLRAKAVRFERTLSKVRAEAARAGEADRHRRFGDLIVHNLASVPRGGKTVRLPEYAAEGKHFVNVPLDPALTPRQNAERHFKQYRRLVRGGERAKARLLDLTRQRDAILRRVAEVEAANENRLVAIALPEPQPRRSPGRRAGETAGKPYREFHAVDGTRIWVGRSAADNDALTFRFARGDDLWLHARGFTGAHVVVRTASAEPSGATLLDAATLAAYYSDARGEAWADVAVSRVKHVRKAKAAPPGAVAVAEERTIRVRPEPDRLARLLAQRAKPTATSS